MPGWTKSGVRESIVEALHPVMAPAGFRFKKAADAFVRKIEAGRQELGLALWDYQPVFQFSLNLCIRLDAVQEIVNRFSGSPPRYHAMTLTSITHLEFIGVPAEAGRDVKFRAASEAELSALFPGLASMVRDRVLPFFEEYRDVAAVNRGLNPAGAEHVNQRQSPPDRAAFDASNEPYRSMTSVAVAHLARDPRWEQLVLAYRGLLSAAPGPHLDKYERLVDSLRGSAGGSHC